MPYRPVSVRRVPLRFLPAALTAMMEKGACWAVEAGYGVERDLARCEEGGAMKQADIRAVSAKARARGIPQGGTLGSGNHFLELQVVSEIYDETAAAAFGLVTGPGLLHDPLRLAGAWPSGLH